MIFVLSKNGNWWPVVIGIKRKSKIWTIRKFIIFSVHCFYYWLWMEMKAIIFCDISLNTPTLSLSFSHTHTITLTHTYTTPHTISHTKHSLIRQFSAKVRKIQAKKNYKQNNYALIKRYEICIGLSRDISDTTKLGKLLIWIRRFLSKPMIFWMFYFLLFWWDFILLLHWSFYISRLNFVAETHNKCWQRLR